MPFNDSKSESLSEYIELLDIISAHLETTSAPSILVGDWNTSLPQKKNLCQTWYRAKPMNIRSLILYDFISSNELAVANFKTLQETNHTYFKGHQKSYIDHVLVPAYMLTDVNYCKIEQHMDNASDHYAIISSLKIDVVSDVSAGYMDNHTFSPTQWSNDNFCDLYRSYLQESLDSHTVLNPDMIHEDNAQGAIDALDSMLTNAMHTAAKKCKAKEKSPKCTHWWTTQCTEAKSKNRFWYKLWVDNDKQDHGVIYECYKESKRHFRKICRNAQNKFLNKPYYAISNYMKHRNTNKLWAAVKHAKNTKEDMHVSKEELSDFLTEKFNDPYPEIHANASQTVQNHFTSSNVNKKLIFPEALVTRYISQLKTAAAPGINGITPSHLKNALSTSLPLHLSALLTLCCRFSMVPESFTRGLIIPIPKPGKDLTTPQGYRPITVSVVVSKLLEYYVLEESSQQEHNPLMFGFIPGRGTDIAIALAHDVCQHSLARGSAVHLASLDAEGAFDFIPHDVLLSKAIDIIPITCWKIMVTWYSRLQAQLKIGQHLDNTVIPIRRGMRQGALTSPMLFNIFYRELIDTLSQDDAGVVINNHKYNVFNFADDVLLASYTISGLQRLLNIAAATISNDGLKFNPAKTVCSTFGPCHYSRDPTWSLNGITLRNQTHIKYLGATLGMNGSKTHTDERISAAQRNFYALQAAGLHRDGVEPQTAGFLHKTVIAPTLTYGCSAISMRKTDIQNIQRCQGNLLKTNLGLYRSSRTTPLLQSLSMRGATSLIEKDTVSLLNRCFKSDSGARTFYSHLLYAKDPVSAKTLVGRARVLCHKLNIDIFKVVFMSNVSSLFCSDSNVNDDGLLDSVKFCLYNFNNFNRTVLQQLVNSF